MIATPDAKSWQEGYASAKHSCSPSDNPYPAASEKAEAWSSGYQVGMTQARTYPMAMAEVIYVRH
jgi:hypothetical protein